MESSSSSLSESSSDADEWAFAADEGDLFVGDDLESAFASAAICACPLDFPSELNSVPVSFALSNI